MDPEAEAAHFKQAGAPTDQQLQDARDLAELGHSQALSRKFSTWSLLALAICVLGTWSTFAQSINSGLENGGPIAVLWGLVLVTACNLCVAVSMGELCSSMPTALGQAYWVSRLWPTPLGRFVSYMCAWINTFGWWALSGTQLAFMSEFLLGLKVVYDNNWTGASTGWVQFLVYLGATLCMTLANIGLSRRDSWLPWYNNFVGTCFITLFFVISLALVISTGVKKDLDFQPAKFVFGKWINNTGWNNGVTWFMGLVQAAYGLTAFDSVVHMVEETPNPRKNIPRVIWMAVAAGAVTGFIFMVVCIACIQDLDSVLDGPTGLPFMDLVVSVVGIDGGAALLALFMINGFMQGVSIVTTASRMTWGFARDGGIPWGSYFSKVNENWKAPVRALFLQGVLVGLIGVLYTFSATAVEAIVNVSTVALTISYVMPIITLLAVGRDKLPPGGTFKLGRWGPLMNYVSIVYCVVTSVFFLFPYGPDAKGANMNWAVVVFAIMLVVSIGFWFIKGSSTYLQTEEAEGRVIEAIQDEAMIQTVKEKEVPGEKGRHT